MIHALAMRWATALDFILAPGQDISKAPPAPCAGYGAAEGLAADKGPSIAPTAR